ncbi:protein kinase family protein [Candidatus Peregrinibacteria bacterium]|nr:protein kinase family protein [Candidatus Peregrinibacteria bacterium]MBT7483847.1 protein kinase family protein [Candidatus Peregrinibacteria bacterium]MBT7702912.1 protein kinase family protein [Candidatus Peregrinibacteria bacterium]
MVEGPFGLRAACNDDDGFLSTEFAGAAEGAPKDFLDEPEGAFGTFRPEDFKDRLTRFVENNPREQRVMMEPLTDIRVAGLEGPGMRPIDLRRLVDFLYVPQEDDHNRTLEEEQAASQEIYSILMYFLEKWQRHLADLLANEGNIVYRPTKEKENALRHKELSPTRPRAECFELRDYPGAAIKTPRDARLQPHAPIHLPRHPRIADWGYLPSEDLMTKARNRELAAWEGPLDDFEDMFREEYENLTFFVGVMERLEAGSLLSQRKKMSLKDCLQVIVDAMVGVEAMHKAELIHRDVKPGNIFVSSEETGWRGKIGDCELVCKDGCCPSRNLGEPAGFAGTPGFMDTWFYEDLRHRGAGYVYGPGADSFSFGMTTLFAYYGKISKSAHDKFKPLFDQVKPGDGPEEILAYLRTFLLWNPTNRPIPEDVLKMVVSSFPYYPENRCELSEMHDVLVQEYDLILD